MTTTPTTLAERTAPLTQGSTTPQTERPTVTPEPSPSRALPWIAAGVAAVAALALAVVLGVVLHGRVADGTALGTAAGPQAAAGTDVRQILPLAGRGAVSEAAPTTRPRLVRTTDTASGSSVTSTPVALQSPQRAAALHRLEVLSRRMS